MDGQTNGRKRVWGSRWLAGFATALLLVGTVAASGLVFGGPRPAEAASVAAKVEIRLTIPGVTEQGHKDWIEIDSFQWGVGRGAANPSSGPAIAEPFVIKKALDASSPKLMQACCTGQHLPEVKIEICRETCEKAKYMVITMENTFISGYSLNSGGDRPVESLSFTFKTVTYEYFEQEKKEGQPTGTVAWDCTNWPECTCRS
jgi:type VI secretion system secreted protein Hcp